MHSYMCARVDVFVPASLDANIERNTVISYINNKLKTQ